MSSYSYLSPDELILINILNTMYNDNYRQIEQLQESNTRIMTSIMNILSNVLHARTRNRQGSTTGGSSPGTSTASNRRENNTNPITNGTRRTSTSSTTTSNGLFNLLNNGMLSNSLLGNNTQPNAFRGGINDIIQSFLEPIEVFPTQSQIEIATRIVRFSDILNPINNSCPISMEQFNDSDNVSVIRECGHIFSTQEINLWFRSNCRCPICRYDIRNYNPSSSRRTLERSQNPSEQIINDMSNNVVPTQDVSNNVVPTSNDMSNNIIPTSNDISGSISTSNIVFAVPYISDMSGNNLNVNDITTLLINYYTRGA